MEVDQTQAYSNENDQARIDMYFIVLDVLEADASEHFEGDEELHEDDQQPDGDHVGWPEEEEGFEHVYQSMQR